MPGSRSSGQPRRRQRRVLSCLPCRVAKFRCNRAVPCQACIQHNREEQCRLNPAPVAVMAPSGPRTIRSSLQRVEVRTGPSLSPLPSPSQSSSPDQHEDGCTSGPSVQGVQGAEGPYDRVPRPSATSFHTSSGSDVLLEGTTVASAVLARPYNAPDRTLLDEPPSFWKQYLISILPSQTQCDMLVSFFFENVNWVYQALHAPAFRSEYATFWTTPVANVNLIWLSLLYMILCTGGIFIPSQMAEAVGFEVPDLPVLSKRWYSACRQALSVGGYDSKPTLTQIQVFLISQLYWYSTKNVEVLNSHMGQAIRNAQALGLDKESPPSITNCHQREMRHRIWWDLASSDTFQSLCLGRQPLLQTHLSTVPFPSNCNDIDITPTAINIRPISEPTEMSIHHFRARIFKTFSKLFIDNGANLSSYTFISQIDAEVQQIMDSYPWYLKDDPATIHHNHLSPSIISTVTWMRHILHSSICMQRVRMYRPFLNPLVGDAWKHCVAGSTSALSIYKSLRNPNVARFQRSPKMHVQTYQVYSAAVTLATFLLVEMPSMADAIRGDIEIVIDDLTAHSKNVGESESRWVPSPLTVDGHKIIRRIVALYEARCKYAAARGGGVASTSVQNDRPSYSTHPDNEGEGPTALVPAIFSVIGGESTAHRYLQRCAVENVSNDLPPATNGGGAPSISTVMATGTSATGTTLEMPAAWDTFTDIDRWYQCSDMLWADLDSFFAMENGVSLMDVFNCWGT